MLITSFQLWNCAYYTPILNVDQGGLRGAVLLWGRGKPPSKCPGTAKPGFGKEMTSYGAEEAAKRNRITVDCEGAEYGEAGGAGVSPASSLTTRADESTAFLVDKTKRRE